MSPGGCLRLPLPRLQASIVYKVRIARSPRRRASITRQDVSRTSNRYAYFEFTSLIFSYFSHLSVCLDVETLGQGPSHPHTKRSYGRPVIHLILSTYSAEHVKEIQSMGSGHVLASSEVPLCALTH